MNLTRLRSHLVLQVSTLLLIITGLASANNVTFEFQGVINNAVNGNPLEPIGFLEGSFGDLSLLVSQPVLGYLSYDPATPSRTGSPTSVFFDGSLVFLIDGKSVATKFLQIDIQNEPNFSTFRMWAWNQGYTIDGVAPPFWSGEEIDLIFSSATPIASTSLPADLSLADFESVVGGVKGNGRFSFAVTSLSKVPDSGSTALLLLLALPAINPIRRLMA